jgi:hypothetical protein
MSSETREITLLTLLRMMQAAGVTRLYAKRLSPNDNSKNQIYLGGDFGVINTLPAGEPKPATSGKHRLPIFKAALSLGWLQPNGAVAPAPGARLILYPQYPEVRFSGFLRSAPGAPADVLTVRDAGRVLFFGVRPDGRLVAWAAAAGSAVAREYLSRGLSAQEGVLERVDLGGAALVADPAANLLAALCRVYSKGWITGWRLLPEGARADCNAPNCVGVTLESELGILANGRSEPDFDGWEVKAYTVTSLDALGSGAVTLMTPEPTGGFYREAGLIPFVDRFGYPDRMGRANRMNFGGVHKVGEVHPTTGLRLMLDGYHTESATIERADGALLLVDGADNVAASWDFSALLSHWGRKHRQTAFVPAMKRGGPASAYRYGKKVQLAEGADFLKLLSGLADGVVYYDPGIKVVRGPTLTTKKRSQFRTSRRHIGMLYGSLAVRDACG